MACPCWGSIRRSFNLLGVELEAAPCSSAQTVVDPVFQTDALELQPVPPAAEIDRPNAVRTFFGGPEGQYS